YVPEEGILRGKGWKEWSLSERMQIKAFICLLGVFLLLLLVVVRLLHGGKAKEEPQQTEPESEIHIPVVEQLHNVWIMEADQEGLLYYQAGEEQRAPIAAIQPQSDEAGEAGSNVQEHLEPAWGTDTWLRALREQVADLELTDGVVTGVTVKAEKVSGRVLAADTTGVWLENLGELEFAKDVQGYRLYRELVTATYRDLCIGYDFADFCLEEGKICAILLTREEAMENIRVLLKNSDYQGIYHDRVELTCDTEFTVKVLSSVDSQENIAAYPAGEVLELTAQRGARLVVEPAAGTGRIILQSVHRSQGIPAYRGSLELWWTEEGIVLVNELPLEEYLYSVVPSEMPASYPQEALMAQAICARTYAYTHMQHAGYEALGAHVDDSSSYQVYNNILEQEAATSAVKATYGQLLMQADGVTPAETFYYSTSWGYGSDAYVWKTRNADQYDYIVPRHLSREEMRRVLEAAAEVSAEAVTPEKLTDEEVFAEAVRSSDPGDFESGEGWYRWTYTVKTLQPDRIRRQLQSRYEANDSLVLTQDGEDYVSSPIGTFHEIRNLTVVARGAGGVADELLIETDQDTYKVISENSIRYVLCDGETKVRRQDGSQVAMNTLLPSAFFTIEIAKDGDCVIGYNLTGGGFGHGVGMSQNGARAMAQEGYSALDILRFFYEGICVREISHDGEAD
ncbi:MAG: SpoIID/LytB domain-containing protein, partial [Acetatifactor sp.]|nr:SpoIID/LytB domain-containing protein [Acetatifactor sp.]